MSETWKAAPGKQGRYEVSDQGRIRSLRVFVHGHDRERRKPRVLKPYRSGGSMWVSQGKGHAGKIAHMVLGAFIGPKPDGHEAMHIDSDVTNNTLGNLLWAHPAENPNRKAGQRKAANNRVARFNGDPNGPGVTDARRMPLTDEWRRMKPTGEEVVAVCTAAKAYGRHATGKKLEADETAYAILNACRPEPRIGDQRWHGLCTLAVALWDEVYSEEAV